MTKRQQLKKLIFDIIDSNHPNSIPQHLLVSGNEGVGKTFIVEGIASELLSRGFKVTKFLYPHCNVVTADDINNIGFAHSFSRRMPQCLLQHLRVSMKVSLTIVCLSMMLFE